MKHLHSTIQNHVAQHFVILTDTKRKDCFIVHRRGYGLYAGTATKFCESTVVKC